MKQKNPKTHQSINKKSLGFLKRNSPWNTELLTLLHDIQEKLMPKTFVQNKQFPLRILFSEGSNPDWACYENCCDERCFSADLLRSVPTHAYSQTSVGIFFFQKSISIYSTFFQCNIKKSSYMPSFTLQ